MLGELPATNDERRRAIQRTIVGVGLLGLAGAQNKEEAFRLFIALRDTLKMDEKDLPYPNYNFTNSLLKAVYIAQKAKYAQNLRLANPDLSNFSLNAFLTFDGSIPQSVKVTAISQVLQELLTAWTLK
jgi:hypothetical protein